CMSDLSGKDGFFWRSSAPIALEVSIAEKRDEFRTQCFSRAAQYKIAGRVRGCRHGAQLPAFLVDDAFTANDHDIFLKVVEVPHTFDNALDIEWIFRDQNYVRLSISRAECDITGLPTHNFDDRNASVAFGSRADAADTLSSHHDGCRISRRDIVDDLIEVENRVGSGTCISISIRFA